MDRGVLQPQLQPGSQALADPGSQPAVGGMDLTSESYGCGWGHGGGMYRAGCRGLGAQPALGGMDLTSESYGCGWGHGGGMGRAGCRGLGAWHGLRVYTVCIYIIINIPVGLRNCNRAPPF